MGQKKISILYVDDDKNNLTAFKATFRSDYEIFIASSAQEGFEVIRNNEIHIVFADQKMPEMTGVQFFELILKEFPDPIRILLTGYSDIESAIASINKGQVYRYISKPWNESELRIAIGNAFEIFDVRQSLYRTNNELKKRNDELNRFVYSASHELKAPLRTIAGILNLAKENPHSDPVPYFAMIDRCITNLDGFIKNIVDYYRNQKYDDYIKQIDFKLLVNEVLENYTLFENNSDINFNILIDQSELFVNDEFRLRVILNNILSNSVKYQKKVNEQKIISVKVSTTKENVFIEIRDNGIGIPIEFQSSVFNMFFRGTDHSQGTGVGLYIVKEALDKINGSVKVDSKEGEGTIVTLNIPNRLNESIQVLGKSDLKIIN